MPNWQTAPSGISLKVQSTPNKSGRNGIVVIKPRELCRRTIHHWHLLFNFKTTKYCFAVKIQSKNIFV